MLEKLSKKVFVTVVCANEKLNSKPQNYFNLKIFRNQIML